MLAQRRADLHLFRKFQTISLPTGLKNDYLEIRTKGLDRFDCILEKESVGFLQLLKAVFLNVGCARISSIWVAYPEG